MNAFVAVILGLAALFAERGARALRRDRAVSEFLPAPTVDTGEPAAPAWRVLSRVQASGLAWSFGAGLVALFVFGPVAALIAAASAWGAFEIRSRRRVARLAAERDEQLADAVRAVSSSLRAGLSAPQAIAYAETESAPPLQSSLEAMSSSLEVGVPFDEALDGFSSDIDTEDARLVTGVLRLHRRSGGDLPAVLDQVADTLRERQAAAREVRALTAQARLSGVILGVLPVGFFAFLWLTSREQIEGAFRTPAGIAALGLGLVMEALAFLWIRHLLEVR
jgi:tight adherence protein B